MSRVFARQGLGLDPARARNLLGGAQLTTVYKPEVPPGEILCVQPRNERKISPEVEAHE
jgi:hypothetical protein